MLSYLKIRNIAIIEEAEIRFSSGLSVLSGETGAGKSIVLDAIGAVLGFRTSRELIRTGASEASVSAVFSGLSDAVSAKMNDFGIVPQDDDTLLLSRVIGQDKNLCKINDTPVTVSALRELGSLLIHIHGQQDSRELLDSAKHLGYIDRVASDETLLAEMDELYERYSLVEREIEKLSVSDAKKARLTDMLNFEINELSMAQIRPGEREALKKRRATLQNAEKLTALLGEVKDAFLGGEGPGACELLSTASARLTKASALYEELLPLSQTVSDLMYAAESAAEELRALPDFDADGNELQEIEERLDLLYRLAVKYGDTEEEMLSYLLRAKEKLDSLIFSEERIRALTIESAALLEQCNEKAAALTAVRKTAAAAFQKAVAAELSYLDMPSTRFEVQFTEAPLSSLGADDVQFLLSANVGEDLKPLTKIASGGELSRIMLAFKSVLSDKDGIDTLIFDEIDAGVSGRAAIKVGQKLKEASKNKQVVCVTHLSQIAAFADTHYLTEKRAEGGKTFTSVTSLDDDGRKKELARIMGGGDITPVQLKNAEELLTYGRKTS